MIGPRDRLKTRVAFSTTVASSLPSPTPVPTGTLSIAPPARFSVTASNRVTPRSGRRRPEFIGETRTRSRCYPARHEKSLGAQLLDRRRDREQRHTRDRLAVQYRRTGHPGGLRCRHRWNGASCFVCDLRNNPCAAVCLINAVPRPTLQARQTGLPGLRSLGNLPAHRGAPIRRWRWWLSAGAGAGPSSAASGFSP